MQPLNKRRNTSSLRTERVQRHWSQRELAERVGASVATVKRWERQASVPGPYFRLKLTALFDKSEEALGLSEAPALPAPPPTREATPEEQTEPVSIAISPLWTVPSQRNPYFTGRDDLFRLLDEHFAGAERDEMPTTRRIAVTHPLALIGLGGIGKTQIAVEYAYRMHEQGVYTHTLWINAASEEAILTSFTSFASLLPALAALHETDPHTLANAIKQWLEECLDPWLLIFDNADDLSSIQPYFPRHGNGSVLLTTRAHAVGSLATPLEVEKMSLLEGMHLLLRRAQRLEQASDDEVSAAEHLVVALDQFPLALEQAGAYMEETGCTFDTYLHLYHTHRSTLLARRGAQAINYPDSVATTWSLSFENVEHVNPAAAQLLQVCAFLAPDAVPEELLREGATYWPAPLQQAVTDPFAFDQLLEALLRFSLVKRLAEDQVVSLHRLVQVVQMEMLTPEEQRQWAERIVRAVNDLFPRRPREDVSSWPQCLRYLEQVQACAMLIEQQQVQLSEAADLLDRAGSYLLAHASYPLAEALFQQALHLREEMLGPDHPETATSLHNLGFLSWEQGKYERAEHYYQQALHIREEQLGTQHLETVQTLNKLCSLLWQWGKYERAESYGLRALVIKAEQLGMHHLETAVSLENLGILLWQWGKYERAESYWLRVLAIREEQLGMHHPDTAKTLDNLGVVSYEQGKYEQAERYHQQALRIREELLGLDHPETARSLDHLGIVSYEQGKYEQAERYYQQALRIREELLGLQHSLTGHTLHNLGVLYFEQGKYERAESSQQRALAILEEQLGAQHVNTAKVLSSLAVLYLDQHKYEQAKLYFTRALAIQEQTIAGNHPNLAKTLHDFARFHEDLGILQTAATLYQRALTIQEQAYDLHHPKTRETRENLQRVLLLLENEEKEVQQDAEHLGQVDVNSRNFKPLG